MAGSYTYKRYIEPIWKQFKSKIPNVPKKSGQTDERREERNR